MIASGQAQPKKDPYQFSQPGRRRSRPGKLSAQGPNMHGVYNPMYSQSPQQQPQVDPNVANDASKQRPPAFQANYQQVDGSWGSQPNYGQRDAFINGINNQTAQYQGGQQQGAPQYDFGAMWSQAGKDVQNGWTNPYAQQPQASPQPPQNAAWYQGPQQDGMMYPSGGSSMPGVINPMYSQSPQQSPLSGLGGQQNTFQPSPGGTISVPFGNGWEPPPMPSDTTDFSRPSTGGQWSMPTNGTWTPPGGVMTTVFQDENGDGVDDRYVWPNGRPNMPILYDPRMMPPRTGGPGQMPKGPDDPRMTPPRTGGPGPLPGWSDDPYMHLDPGYQGQGDPMYDKMRQDWEGWVKKFGANNVQTWEQFMQTGKSGYERELGSLGRYRASLKKLTEEAYVKQPAHAKKGGSQAPKASPQSTDLPAHRKGDPSKMVAWQKKEYDQIMANRKSSNEQAADRDMIASYLGYRIMPGNEWQYDSLLKGWKAEESATKKGNAVKAERDEATKKAYYGKSSNEQAADRDMIASYLGYRIMPGNEWQYDSLLKGWKAEESATKKGNAVKAERDEARKKAYYG